MTLARDIPQLPYMGSLEDTLRTAFVSSYDPVVSICRTPYLAGQLERELTGRGSPRARVERSLVVIDEHLLSAEAELGELWYPAILPVTAVASAFSRMGVRHESMSKSFTDLQHKVIRRGHRPKTTRSRFRLRPSSRDRHLHNADQRHVQSAKQLTLDLVTHVTATQSGKMRMILTQSITKGINADVTGARIANVVGLFPRWQNAVDNFHAALIENGQTASYANKRAAEYADALRDKRGIMIARTELMRSMNDGRLAGWQDMAERGVILGDVSIKEWVTGPDACDECRDVQLVYGIDTTFDTNWGPLAMPPAHPHCRCSCNLRIERGTNDDRHGQRIDEATVQAFPEVSGLLARFGVDDGYWA